MKKKLTEMAVGKLNPEAGKRLEVFDTLTPGLALRVTEAGKKSWSVMYRVAGRDDDGNRGALRRMRPISAGTFDRRYCNIADIQSNNYDVIAFKNVTHKALIVATIEPFE